MKRWNREDNDRLSQKFTNLMKKNSLNNDRMKRFVKENEVRIQESRKICDRRLVYNLSDKQIPKETEELIGRLGFNFQFTLTKFPSIEVTQATELCCQKIEKANTGDDERLAVMNRESCTRQAISKYAYQTKYNEKGMDTFKGI